jgi:hypothetical protein
MPQIFHKQLKELPSLPHENFMAAVYFRLHKENSRQTEIATAMKANFFLCQRPVPSV